MEKNFKFGVFQNDKNIDLTIFQYGWEQCAPLHSYGPAKRNHYLFHFIFSGEGYLSSNDSSGVTHLHRLETCQGFLICPDQVNTITRMNSCPDPGRTNAHHRQSGKISHLSNRPSVSFV